MRLNLYAQTEHSRNLVKKLAHGRAVISLQNSDWLQAQTEAVIKAKARPARTAGVKNGAKPRTARDKAITQAPPAKEVMLPGGFERMPIPGVPNAFIQYPVELTDAHCAMLEATIPVLRAYVKSRSGSPGGKGK